MLPRAGQGRPLGGVRDRVSQRGAPGGAGRKGGGRRPGGQSRLWVSVWSQGCGHRAGTEQRKPARAGHCSGGPVPAQPVGTQCSRQTVQDTCGPGAGGCPGCGRSPSRRGCTQRWPPPASDTGVSLRNLPGAGLRAPGAQTGPAGPGRDGGRAPSGSAWRGSGQAPRARPREPHVSIMAAPARRGSSRRSRWLCPAQVPSQQLPQGTRAPGTHGRAWGAGLVHGPGSKGCSR